MKTSFSGVFCVLLLSACASVQDSVPSPGWAGSPWTEASGVLVNEADRLASAGKRDSPWYHYPLPGKKPTEFNFTRYNGRDAMAVHAQSSASMLRRKVHVIPAELGQIHFSWNVPDLIAVADMSQRDLDDSPVRVVMAFEGDRSRFSAKNAILNELTRALTGEEMPYAVLMYVWSKQRPIASVIHSPRTDRIRKLVVESGGARLHQWLDYQRDIAADFEAVFGESPGALVGIGIMTDTDNTQTTAKAWYGPLSVSLKRAAAHPP